jgi:predicted transcriptional regulator
MTQWTFFTNHGHILFTIAINPTLPVREIASQVGITERAALKIISDLVNDEFISIKKDGRNNVYTVNLTKHLRHDIEKESTVGEIIKAVKKSKKLAL